MFSKILIFCIASLPCVYAAPASQGPLVSCSVQLSSTSAAALSTPRGPSAGTYYIINAATSSQVRSSGILEPLFVSYPFDGPEAQWKVEPVGSNLNEYTIYNVELGTPTFVNSYDQVLPGPPKTEPHYFTIVPAKFKRNTFTIGVSNPEAVWTIDKDSERSPVTVSEKSGGTEQLWRFVGVEDEDELQRLLA